MARSRITTAPKVKLFINGRVFAQVTGFNWSCDTPRSSKYGLDSVTPFEIASTITRGSGAMSILKLSGDGAAQGAGMVASFADLSREKYFSITLLEIETQNTIFQAGRCTLVNETWSLGARGIMVGNLNFEFIDYLNETNRFSQQ